MTATPAGFTAQDLATMQAPMAMDAPIALAETAANAQATGETKPEVKIVATASAQTTAPAIAPAVAPEIVAPNQYFGSDNARPHRLPMAGR